MKPNFHKASKLAATLSLLCLLSGREAKAVTYNFNSYNTGDLNGQAGWGSEGFNGASGIQISTGSFDSSRFALFSDAGAGRGASAWNMGAFSTLNGSETVTLQFDFRAGTTQSNYVGLGWDNSAGKVTLNSASTRHGFEIKTDLTGGIEVFLNGGSLGSDSGGFTDGGWYTIRVDLNLAANSGAGSFSVVSKVANASSFDPVANLQNIYLGLDTFASSASDPTLWNTLWFHNEGGFAGTDNILITAVPEPGPVALLATGVIGLMMVVRKRRA